MLRKRLSGPSAPTSSCPSRSSLTSMPQPPPCQHSTLPRQVVLAHSVSRIPVVQVMAIPQPPPPDADPRAAQPARFPLALTHVVQPGNSSTGSAPQQQQPGLTVREPGDSRKQHSTRLDLPQGELSTLTVAPPLGARQRIKGKGGKFASVAAGPWVAALARMPKPMPTALQRVRLGLADVPLNNEDHVAVEQEP